MRRSKAENNCRTSGFSIIETLVAVGVVSLVMAGIASFAGSMSRNNRSTLQRGLARDLNSTTKALLNDETSCTLNLGNGQYHIGLTPGASVNVPALYYLLGAGLNTSNPVVQVPLYYRNDPNGIKVSQMSLVFRAPLGPVVPAFGQPPSPTLTLNALDFSIQATRTGPTANQPPVQVRIPFLAVIDSSGAIQSCYADSLATGVVNFENTLCETIGAGGQYYAPAQIGFNGGCQYKCYTSTGYLIPPNPPPTLPGSQSTASCPAGKTLNFQMGNPCIGVGGVPPPNPPSENVTYVNAGGSNTGAFNASTAEGNSNGSTTTCTCFWLAGATPGVCSACCAGYDVAQKGSP